MRSEILPQSYLFAIIEILLKHCWFPSPLIISSLQVTTSIEQQSSLCERNTTAGISTQGKDRWKTEDAQMCQVFH